MIGSHRIGVVLPAFNAEKTLEMTVREIPLGLVDEVILVDDCSNDRTIALARRLGIRHIVAHECNRGYGANQKTCYSRALELGCDIVVMVHPDYQYTPRLIPAMCHVIHSGLYPVVLGSRILGNGARKGGMPLWKYVVNRVLTLIQNLLCGEKLSEYHSGSLDIFNHPYGPRCPENHQKYQAPRAITGRVARDSTPPSRVGVSGIPRTG